MPARVAAAIMISGRGSNMLALLRAAEAPDFPARFVRVLSDKPQAAGLLAARALGLETQVVDPLDAEGIDAALGAVELTCLAGYMRLLPAALTHRRAGQIINIHPSLLPRFKGLNAQAQALAAGVEVSGATVHQVTERLDDGEIILQEEVPVLPDDDVERLSARILATEHRLYPAAVRKVLG